MTGNRREDQRRLTQERQGSRLDSHRRRQQGRLTQEREGSRLDPHRRERGAGRLSQEREGSGEAHSGERGEWGDSPRRREQGCCGQEGGPAESDGIRKAGTGAISHLRKSHAEMNGLHFQK